jgi:hypothetical protein
MSVQEQESLLLKRRGYLQALMDNRVTPRDERLREVYLKRLMSTQTCLPMEVRITFYSLPMQTILGHLQRRE